MSSIPKEDIECLECGEVYATRVALSAHLRTHKMTSREYVDKHYDAPMCAYCDEPASRKNSWTFRATCGSKPCFRKVSSIPHTSETKAKIREARLKYLAKKGGQTAWEKRAAGKMSYLEKWFYDRVIKEHQLADSNQIIAEHRVSRYSIDYAFMNLKLAVELDGKCHFKNGKQRIQADIRKAKALQDRGWFVYRIAWDEVQHHPGETVQKFMQFLDERLEGGSGCNVDEGYFWDRHEASERRKREKAMKALERNRKRQSRQAKQRRTSKKPKQPRKAAKPRTTVKRDTKVARWKHLQSCSIDFQKYGWVSILSEQWGISPQATGRYIRKNYPEFYEDNCRTRNSE